MKIMLTMFRKEKRDILVEWVVWQILETIFSFAREGGMDHNFTEVGPTSNSGLFQPDERNSLCS